MADNLYEILGIRKDATTDEIRKAYKKKALLTHPDRLPQGASATDKASSEEQFRIVNNAYEVLNNPENRRAYDSYGVWPPPEEETSPYSRRYSRRHGPYDRQTDPGPHFDFFEPFFSPPSGNFSRFTHRQPHSHFAFTDPFAVFEEAFGSDFSNHFMHSTRSHHRPFHSHRSHADNQDVAGMSGFPLLPRPFGPNFPMFPGMGTDYDDGPSRNTTRMFSSEMRSSNIRGRWVSDRRTTSTINGMTESTWSRVDDEGREHVTRTFPDGTERYTIDGVEQSGNRHGETTGFIPPPPPYPGIEDSPRRSRSSRHHSRASLTPPPGSFGPVIPDLEQNHNQKERRWWRGNGWSR